MDKCRWLLVGELVKYHSLFSLWTIIHRKILVKLFEELNIDNEMIIRSAAPRLLTVAHVYRWRTIAVWNQLGMEIRGESSLPQLKKNVKI